DSARRGDLLEVEAALELLRRLPQPQSVPVLDRCDRHVQLVDQVGVEELAHRRDPAADPHVLAVGELERALEGGGGGGVEEVEGRLAGCERLPLVMSEHDDGRVEGRILAPPAAAPMPRGKSRVRWSSNPREPPGSVRPGKLAVSNAQLIRTMGSTCPKGRSAVWSSPAPMPSRETEKFWTRTRGVMGSPLGGASMVRPAAARVTGSAAARPGVRGREADRAIRVPEPERHRRGRRTRGTRSPLPQDPQPRSTAETRASMTCGSDRIAERAARPQACRSSTVLAVITSRRR